MPTRSKTMQHLPLVVFFLTFYACGPSAEKNDWPDSRIKDWLAYYDLDYEGFEKSHRFERPYSVTYDFQAESDDIYTRFYVYNADSTQAIDLDSYHLALEKRDDGTLYSRGREPDMEVSLICFEENKRIRKLFCGTPCIFEEAAFDPEGRMVVAGHIENDRGYKPVMWVMPPNGTFIEQHAYLKDEERIHPAREIRYIADIRLEEVTFWHDDKAPSLDVPL